MRRATIAAAIGAVALMGTSLGANASAEDRHHPHPGAGRLDHVYVLMLENHSQVQRDRRPERAVHHRARPHLHDGRPLLRRHAPVDAELHRQHRRRQLRHPGRQRPERRQPRPAQPRRPARVQAHPVGRLHGGPPGRQAGALRSGAGRRVPDLPLREEAQSLRALRRRQEQPGPDGQDQGLQPAGRRPEQEGRAAVRLDQPRTSATTCTAASTTPCPGTPRRRAATAAPRTTPTTPPSSRRATPS